MPRFSIKDIKLHIPVNIILGFFVLSIIDLGGTVKRVN